ncbi:uncharacterized protein EI90DRAFT_2065058 [Cantharellus anzutake]|uniref:uncharacterized protein n=1 Tax=Cantharellus anzutake TaxID=1750568 RepID=UPI00190814B0|nr:uncharacterized protein EI90DRAFT_2065058 [Cantharellus anzutake]KAF8340454.1 hypothetical protein EI90DRAFT_2065058 [Cantharellus anzutake]
MLFCSLASSPILPVTLGLTLTLRILPDHAVALPLSAAWLNVQRTNFSPLLRPPISAAHVFVAQCAARWPEKLALGAKKVILKQSTPQFPPTLVCAARKARRVAGCATSGGVPSYLFQSPLPVQAEVFRLNTSSLGTKPSCSTRAPPNADILDNVNILKMQSKRFKLEVSIVKTEDEVCLVAWSIPLADSRILGLDD